jgi:uncharacterized membrane protein YdjX (TVP38/TMEM64 family)
VSGDPQSTREDPPGDGHPSLTGAAIALGGVLVLAALVFAIEPLRTGVSDAVSGDTEALREEIRDLGFGGVLIVLALALVHVVVWYPAEILDAAVGFVYDFWVALALVMAAWIVNAVIAYWIGRHAARPLLYRFVAQERFEQLERIAERGGVPLLLAMRLVPIVPFSLFSYVAGAARVPMPRFLWTTAIGYIPITAVFVYLGNRLEELSPTDPILWGGALVLIALLWFTRRLRGMLSEDSSDAPVDRAEA